MAEFFIHHLDPGFMEPPWPGVRRLGPYNTVEEARAQAESDAAGGYGTALGIYTDGESEALRERSAEEQESGPATVTREDISKAADVLRQRQVEGRLAAMAEDRAALSSILPEGITVDDLTGI